MGTRTVYTCDRCKKEYTGEEVSAQRFLTLTLNYSWLEMSHRTSKAREELWCGACVDQVRLFTPMHFPEDLLRHLDPPPPPPPSFEDLLRELIREEADAAVDRRYDK